MNSKMHSYLKQRKKKNRKNNKEKIHLVNGAISFQGNGRSQKRKS